MNSYIRGFPLLFPVRGSRFSTWGTWQFVAIFYFIWNHIARQFVLAKKYVYWFCQPLLTKSDNNNAPSANIHKLSPIPIRFTHSWYSYSITPDNHSQASHLFWRQQSWTKKRGIYFLRHCLSTAHGTRPSFSGNLLMLFWWYAKFCTRFLVLLMMWCRLRGSYFTRNCGFVKRLKRQKSNAQNLSRINQRKDHNISKITDNL